MNKQTILANIQEHGAEFQAYPLQMIYLHGSVARGTATPISDIDFALVVADQVPVKDYLDVELELELLLCRILKTDKVEARIINKAPLGFQGQVLTHGVLAYSRDEEFRVEFETSTRMHYFDFLPVIQQMNRVFFDRLKKESRHGQPS